MISPFNAWASWIASRVLPEAVGPIKAMAEGRFIAELKAISKWQRVANLAVWIGLGG